MNPNSQDLITLFNPDSNPFEIRYDGNSYGFIEPNGKKVLPRFLAEFALEHLVDQCLNTRDVSTRNMVERQKLYITCVQQEQSIVGEHKETEAERLQREIEELNQPTGLEYAMAQHDSPAAAPETPPVFPDVPPVQTAPEAAPVIPEPEVPAPAPVVDPTPEVVNEQPAQEPAAPIVTQDAPVTTEPTRQELYDFARNQNVLDLSDPATLQTLENASLPELKNLVQWHS